LAVGVNNAIVTVVGNKITSIGNVNNLTKKIQVDVSYNDNQMVITSWKEIP